jgi:hypothetical protein
MKQIPVRIEGEWQPVAYVGRACWEGLATADEPITALALCRTPSLVRFARAGRSDAVALRVRLSVSPDEPSESRYDVVVHLSVQPPGRTDGTGMALVHAPLRLSSTAPFMFSMDHHQTGAPAWFARAHAAERTDFGALFVASSDTRSARNHLWHLRPGIEGPDEPLTAALAHGRAGEYPVPS